ncbi:MAG: acyl-CoA/acyl-ACP dehydrogenase [Balneolales bacterium]|nr:acyl-CoA/acyl-ACP dehydrogenase [Balneolales bacterium]
MDYTSVKTSVTHLNFTEFIENYKKVLSDLFSERSNLEEISLNRGLPPFVMRDIMACEPLSVFISKEYNGRGGNVQEALSVLEATSYESLPLSLMVGINGALFLQPVSIYGSEEAKNNVLSSFTSERKLGGLMITEPDFGSDALKMKTSYDASSEGYHLKGTKHWAGLTGWADYWLLTGRELNKDGDLNRDIDFFIHDNTKKGIEVSEVYQNLGLYMLPYGKNEVDAVIPHGYKLIPKSNGITMMLDILHRSRLQFPGMGIGFVRRLLDEAIDHCKNRIVGGSPLISYDQVKHRISKIQSYYTVLSAMCAYTSENAGMDKDLSRSDVPANAIKTIVTDYMQDAAQSLLQLVGAKGYRLNHIAGRSVVDSRPYQIFEGSNDILYQQLSESVLKMMRKAKQSNLYEFLNNYHLSVKSAQILKDSLDFSVDMKIAQRKLVQLGKILGRVLSLNMVIELGEKGFRSDMINHSIENLKIEVRSAFAAYQTDTLPDIVIDYHEESSWANITGK